MRKYLQIIGKLVGIASIALTINNKSIAQDSKDLLDMSLEDLMNMEVTTASKKAESLNDAPGIISVISRQEIDGFYAQNLGQVLSKIVGTSFQSPDVFVNQSIIVRGQESTPYNNHVLILINGRPFRDPITGGHNASIYSGFPIDVIDHIEVIRGPGSVLYGSCAYSGVINVITAKGNANTFQGDANIRIGTQESIIGSSAFSFNTDDLQVSMGVYGQDSKGPLFSFFGYNQDLNEAQAADVKNNPDNYIVTGKKFDAVTNDSVPTSAYVKGSEYFSTRSIGTYGNLLYKGFSLNVSAIDFQHLALNGGGEYFEKGSVTQHKSYMADLGYAYDISKDFSIAANYTFNNHTWYGEVGSASNLGTGTSNLFELNVRYQPVENMNILVGGGYELNTWHGDIIISKDLNAMFGYTQIDYKFLNMFKAIAGMQVNKIDKIDANLSPRIGLIANLNENFGAKILYSQAFRRGYANETGFNHPVFKGNDSLKPEIISTFEAQLFYNSKVIQSSVTFYHSVMTDIITRKAYFEPSFYFKYLNGGDWTFNGIEAEVKWSIMDNLFLIANAYWQTNTKADTVDNASLHPNAMVKGGLLYSNKLVTIGVYNSFFGEPHATSLVNPSTKDLNPKAEAYNLLSAKVSIELNTLLGIQSEKSISLFIEGDNLLDKYITYPDYPNKQVNTLIPLYEGIVFNVGMNVKL